MCDLKNIRIIDIGSNNIISFRKVFIDNDTWCIVDMFGNIVSPFFIGDGKIILYQDSKCLVLGTEEKGKTELYNIITDRNNPDDSMCKKVHFPFEVKSFYLFEEENIVFLTSEGLCLIDSDTLRQKSDFYDSIYRYGDSKRVAYVYEKEISNDAISTVLTGPITLDGKVGKKAYDTFFNKEREVEVSVVSEFHYHVIDKTSIIRELNDKVDETNKKKMNGIRKILTSDKK